MSISIVTETTERWSIPNQQNYDLAGNEVALSDWFAKTYDAKRRSDPSPIYNCHGLTFASRRTTISEPSVVQKIIEDDKYKIVQPDLVMPGDVIIYYDEVGGEIAHSGIVVELTFLPGCPNVVSKWGMAAEFMHRAHVSPYGRNYEFYRINRGAEIQAILNVVVNL